MLSAYVQLVSKSQCLNADLHNSRQHSSIDTYMLIHENFLLINMIIIIPVAVNRKILHFLMVLK